MDIFRSFGALLESAEGQVGQAVSDAREVLCEMEREAVALYEMRRQLERDIKTLQAERSKFELEKTRLADATVSEDDVVRLDVGGVHFTTFRKTIMATEGMLAAWFSGRHRVVTDRNGRVVLDRDPELFGIILEYLRGGAKEIPSSAHSVDQTRLMHEFDYFCLQWPTEKPSLARVMGEGYTAFTLLGHTDKVQAVDINDKHVLSAGSDRKVRLWDVHTGKCVRTYEGHEHMVECVALGDQAVASGSFDKTVRVWDLRTGAQQHLLAVDARAKAVGLGTNVVAACAGKWHGQASISVWELQTGRLLSKIPGTNVMIGNIAFYGDCVVGGANTQVKMWDLVSGRCLRTLDGHRETVVGALLTPTGQLVTCGFSGVGQAEYIVWDPAAGTLLQRTVRERVFSSSFAYTGRSLVFGDTECGLKVTEVREGKGGDGVELKGHSGMVTDVASCGDMLASCSLDGTVRVWRPAPESPQMIGRSAAKRAKGGE